MDTVVSFFVLFIALEHFGFLYLEMFLWSKPVGQKIFKLEPDFAPASAALASNQGLYNGFLGAGLFWSLLANDPDFAWQLKVFFLSCVFVAGIYGWMTVSKTILKVQAIPAALTLILLFCC